MAVKELTEEVATACLTELTDKMGMLDDYDKAPFETAIKRANHWLLGILLKEPNYVVEAYSLEAGLIVERARYDLSNSLDIFQKNYGQEIVQVTEDHALTEWLDNGGL